MQTTKKIGLVSVNEFYFVCLERQTSIIPYSRKPFSLNWGSGFLFYNSDKTQNKEKLVKYFLKQADLAISPKQKDYSGVVENTGKMSDNLSPCRLNSIGVVQFYIELIKKIKSFARSFLKILSKGNCNTKTICLIHRTALVSQVCFKG